LEFYGFSTSSSLQDSFTSPNDLFLLYLAALCFPVYFFSSGFPRPSLPTIYEKLQWTHSLLTIAWDVAPHEMAELYRKHKTSKKPMLFRFVNARKEIVNLSGGSNEQKTMWIYDTQDIGRGNPLRESSIVEMVEFMIDAADPFIFPRVVALLDGRNEFGQIAFAELSDFWEMFPSSRESGLCALPKIKAMAKGSSSTYRRHTPLAKKSKPAPPKDAATEETPLGEMCTESASRIDVFEFHVDLLTKVRLAEKSYSHILWVFTEVVSDNSFRSMTDIFIRSYQFWESISDETVLGRSSEKLQTFWNKSVNLLIV
jgi:hypothetical protein